MTYITTQHQFTLDERHPADVFDEMSNFFSLYTVSQDSLQQMSLQLTAPANFDIENKPKLAKAYQQFIKAVKYSIPDSHILPIQYSDKLQAGELQLMLQHNGMNAVLEGEPTPFYQKVLGVFLPKFEATTSETGLYPEQSPIQALSVPQPLQQTAPPATSQPVPQPIPPSQPAPQPAVQASTPANLLTQPVQMPLPVVQPIAQPPKPQMPVPPVAKPVQQPIPTLPTLPKLPKTTVSIKPYRELLTQAIVAQAQQEGKGRSITQITLKSTDSLTTAVIETIFTSFHKDTPNRAYDAIDMVSYGLEELRPALAKVGIHLAEDTQFALNAKVKASSHDFAQLTAGQVSGDSVKIGITPQYGNGKNEPFTPVAPSVASRPTQNPPSQTLQGSQTLQESQALTADNTNSLNITINVHISDDMGERTVKARQFPLNFTTQMHTDGHSIKLAIAKPAINKQTGKLFSVVENQGNLAIATISPAIQLVKSGKVIQNGAVLLPNDVLEIENCNIHFSVGN